MATLALGPDAERADRILDGTLREPATEVVTLGKDLARQGDRDRARRLHAKRLELDTKRAYAILSGVEADPAERLELAKRLAGDKCIGLARRVLAGALDALKPGDDLYRPVCQKSALYTYKDPDLPVEWRLDRALVILERAESLATAEDPETLGLAGAIHKRKWEVDSARHHLERALGFYLRGYARSAPASGDVLLYLRRNRGCVLDARKDRGYNGINAAFVLDLLAQLEDEGAGFAGVVSPAAAERRESARLIRDEITRSVPPLRDHPQLGSLKEEWWFYATIGEAYFGLGAHDPSNYARAVEWLVTEPARAGLEQRRGGAPTGALDVPEWEFESTARQLARLVLLHAHAGMTAQQIEASPAGQALDAILGNDRQAVDSSLRGKIGLALSGGGFRASLFHIGVLACLAERDVLRHVEALSCVSGGSIIGAHYYLELRHLLQGRPDGEITASDYVRVVERICERFLQGVQRNIRTRVLAEWTTNLKMIFKAGYSRTLRVGELYERELFSRVGDGHFQGPRILPDWIAERLGYRRRRWLNDVYIRPMRDDRTIEAEFQPRNHNWRRRNKVPTLILNAATLNTGHCWQFTASYMGEPPMPINAEIDANERLRRMYYADAPAAYRKLRLGHAVAASSCVPGLFEPLILDGLYPARSVRLVDGGVCDNQGISSLLEQDCTVALVSDASGQMDSQPVPSSGTVGVPLRANTILQARVREAQYTDAATRKRSLLLRGLMFVHLKRDLPTEQVTWADCPSYLKNSEYLSEREAAPDATSFGIAVGTQRQLSAIRTDLDSFNDIEAFALMTSGYRMTEAQFDGRSPCVPGFAERVAKGSWKFLDDALEHALQPPAMAGNAATRREHVTKVLGAGALLAFKIWQLSPVLRVLKWALAALVIGAGSWLLYGRRQESVLRTVGNALPERIRNLTFGDVALAGLTAVGVAVLSVALNRLFGHRYARGIMKVVRWRDTVRSVAIGISMASVGFLVARLHLHVFDRWFLRFGSVRTVRP